MLCLTTSLKMLSQTTHREMYLCLDSSCERVCPKGTRSILGSSALADNHLERLGVNIGNITYANTKDTTVIDYRLFKYFVDPNSN